MTKLRSNKDYVQCPEGVDAIRRRIDEDYVVDKGNDDDRQDDDDENDDEEDDEEITLQTGKAEQRKQKRQTKVADVVEERRTVGQLCANVDQATEFRKYIRDLMKTFEEHICEHVLCSFYRSP